MSESNVPEVVLFTDGRGTRPALVLSSRTGEVSHLGKNGEPLLMLAVKKLPPPNPGNKKPTAVQIATSIPEVEILHDVVHASHEFDRAYWDGKKISTPTAHDVASHRGHGEWSEFPAANPEPEAKPTE